MSLSRSTCAASTGTARDVIPRVPSRSTCTISTGMARDVMAIGAGTIDTYNIHGKDRLGAGSRRECG